MAQGYKRVKPLWGPGAVGNEGSQGFSLISAATTNATLVVAGPCLLTALIGMNVSAAAKFLRLYDAAKVPTAGSGTPSRRIVIPGSTTGAGLVLAPCVPMRFLTGLALTITGASPDNDTTALALGDVILSLEYIA